MKAYTKFRLGPDSIITGGINACGNCARMAMLLASKVLIKEGVTA